VKVALSVVRARREKMAELLRQHRYLPVNELCARLGISEATARRDLSVLQKEKKLFRTYGGAFSDYGKNFASFSERQEMAAEAKRRIARRALAFIPADSTIYLDAGTTIFALAEELKNSPVRPLTVVTNSLPVVELLAGIRGIESHVLGGQFVGRQSALLGDGKRSALPAWKFDFAFMSAEGMTAEGIWNSQSDLVTFQKSVLSRSRNACFCLDSSKLGKLTGSFLLPWNRVKQLICDTTEKKLLSAGIEVGKDQLVRV